MTTETYHERPVLKEPVWIWAVPVYFVTGGLAGAAAALGAAAQIFGRGRLDGLVERCRGLAATGTVLGGALLIYDLGRPERFLNMLRVFRPTSSMNVGAWLLAVEGALSSFAVAARKKAPRLAGTAGLGAGLTAIPFTGYTAVLLSDTSVPVWKATGRTLPFLFVASSASTATALLDMASLNDDERRVVDRLGWAANAAELAAAAAVSRDASQIERVGRPLREGVSGSLWRASTGAALASAGLSALPADSRLRRALSPLLGILGSLALRFSVFFAGRASARDPRATFEPQR